MLLVATNFSRNVMMSITMITVSLMGSCSVARMCKLVIFTIAALYIVGNECLDNNATGKILNGLHTCAGRPQSWY